MESFPGVIEEGAERERPYKEDEASKGSER